MSRDALAPPAFGRISERFNTPVYSITFTGTIVLVLIAFVPVVSLAKLASAFQLLVFVFVNGALIAFRESGLEWYDPAYTAPGYPWVQLFGTGGGLLLLTQMGPLPLAGAVGIVVASTSAHHWLFDIVFGTVPDQLATNARATVLLTHSQAPRRRTFIRYLLNEYVF
jgi:amino acid transporter